MKRDIDLERLILLEIENKYLPGSGTILGLEIEGYQSEIVGEHCKLLFEQKFIGGYVPFYADNKLYSFSVKNLTPAGYDYLELIRSDNIWKKTKKAVEEKELPKTTEHLAKVAGIFIGQVIDQIKP